MSSEALALLPSGRVVDVLNDHSWASSRLISEAIANGNSRATLPLATLSEGRDVWGRHRPSGELPDPHVHAGLGLQGR
jgi:hypothetical protein